MCVKMAVQHYQFGFRNVELFKEDTLGTGSYGGVCKARCDGLPCAAKIMHPTFFDLRDLGTVSYLQRFEEESRLLSSARHPNVVQYLGTYQDPETRLPVLLMELCDESLCHFLERSPRPIPYHIQVNIAHDIALALVYLHLNNITHRDLTANNVLMIAGARAKVTDFGMSKLASVNPHTTPMTLCPGNVQYMSPEALEEPPSYTHKLDVFAFGVLLVQIMTRQFPDPGPRFQVVSALNFPEGTIRRAVPETERRSSHLRMIADTHPLKTIAITCLKNKEQERPSAQRLNRTLSGLKQEPAYTQSLQQAQTCMESLRSQTQYLHQQTHARREQKEEVIAQKQIENEQLQAQVQKLQQQLQSQQILTEAKTREVLELQNTVQDKERELQEKDRAIRTSELLLVQFKQTLVEKDRVISDLQQTIPVENQPASGRIGKTATATVLAQRDVSKLRWKDGKKAPEDMTRGSTVVDGNSVYIKPGGGSFKIYSCQITSQNMKWSTLPNTEYSRSSLAIINGILTTIGGYKHSEWTNSLLSLTGRGGRRQWSNIFPAMPTPRSQTVSVTTQQTLIVAGGVAEGENLDIVEVMDIPTKRWTTASHLPHPFGGISGTVCGDQLYLAGGCVGLAKQSKSVLTCSVTDLLSPKSLAAGLRTLSLADKTGVWRHVRDLPVTLSTLITLGGHLLAIGGENSGGDPADVHCYDTHTDSWQVVSSMKKQHRLCLAAVLPEDCLVVVGGSCDYEVTDSVEIGSLQ